MDSRESFYLEVINKLLDSKESSVLVCCGGDVDKNIFELAGFKNVTISNLDERMKGDEFFPYRYENEDVMSLSFENESFDYTIVRDGIHHVSSPHVAVTEMYRVAKKGILCIESRDSFLLKLLVKMGISQAYEHSAVYYNDSKYGGVNNSEIPNYVYRWTERDVYKTISSYAPYAKHKFLFKYGSSFPAIPKEENKNTFKLIILYLMIPIYWIFVKLFRKQQNLFAFYIEKPSIPKMLFNWIKYENNNTIKFNKEWANKIYKDETKN